MSGYTSFGSPMLTIVVPAWNSKGTIGRCLESISCAAEAASSSSFEVICIDDGSVDDTALVAEGFARHHDWLRVLRQPNGGVSVARNAGIHEAQGEYITFVDADDTIEPGFFSSTLPLLGSGRYDCLFFCSQKIDSKAHVEPIGLIPARSREGAEGDFFGAILEPSSPYQGFAVAKCVRRRLLLEAEGGLRFDASIRILEDEWFWLHVAPHCGRIYLLNEILYNYTQSPAGATARINAEAPFEDLAMRERIIEYVEGASPAYARLAKTRLVLKVAGSVRRFYVTGDEKNLTRLRPYWERARAYQREVGVCAAMPDGMRAKIALCDIAMAARLPVGALAPFRRLLARDNARLAASIEHKESC